MTAIMYVCDACLEGAPERCGHDDRTELRAIPASSNYVETTVCEDWHELPLPAEFRPVGEQK